MTTAATVAAVNASLLDLEQKKVLLAVLANESAVVAALHTTVLADLTAIATSLNQLITDYNANTNIVTDTTAAAVTLTTT